VNLHQNDISGVMNGESSPCSFYASSKNCKFSLSDVSKHYVERMFFSCHILQWPAQMPSTSKNPRVIKTRHHIIKIYPIPKASICNPYSA
jgi:hypothetical protein